MVDTNPSDGGTQPPLAASRAARHSDAALLLVESLIHGLIARAVITPSDAHEIVTVAIDVKSEIAAEMGDPPAISEEALAGLREIRASLETDLDRDAVRPWPPVVE